MAATTSLLELNTLKWNHLRLHPPIFPHRAAKFNNATLRNFQTLHQNSAKFNSSRLVVVIKCCSTPEKRPLSAGADPNRSGLLFDPLGVVTGAVSKAWHALKKPAAVAVLLGLLLMYDPNSALAASGGRVGGRAFSSSSSRSSSSSSRSYRVDPRVSYSAPYYAPTPFGGGGGGFYVGPAVGVGVGAGSSLFLIFMGFAAFVLVSGFLSDRSEGSVLTATEKTSVIKLQVGLLGMARSLQSDLNRIAEVADTSTPEGLTYILTETTLSLLRHPDYCISGYSFVDVKRSLEDGEKRFNQLSIEERGKFDEETLVNVNNIRRQSTTSKRASGFSNEYIVITILVAAEGVHKLPSINGSGELKEALQKLGSIPSSKIMAVEVLWTPQNENDTLSERELLEDYPLLRPL
ncbi:hypothetical protein ACOSP7_014854 [Xanthoceras sorbifolium]|uniref:Myelin-associated oligodendrocyte basic protein n=1 Tax=Xanthoceras sorbifolium TaxID=99658 RepID=A0ABQ8GZZ8_9ROSI|nr:hypothetical protein JRO89_XSUnG0041200 [Xanthoceras sorbifolium]